MHDNFEHFERGLLEMLLAGNDPVLDTLRGQLAFSLQKRREFTGVGFFSYIQVSADASRLSGAPSFVFGDVVAEISGLEHGAGFLLFITDGVIGMLEGFCYGEEWPEQITTYKLSYVRWSSGNAVTVPSRDLNSVYQTSGWPPAS